MQLAKTGLVINPWALGKLDTQLVGAEVCRRFREHIQHPPGNRGLWLPTRDWGMWLLMLGIPECDYLYLKAKTNMEMGNSLH